MSASYPDAEELAVAVDAAVCPMRGVLSLIVDDPEIGRVIINDELSS